VLPAAEHIGKAVYAVAPEQFQSHMAFLKERGFRSLSLEEYGEMAMGRHPVDSPSVLITFDDGYADNYQIAWPIMRGFGMKMNLFLLTGFIGQPQIMNSIEKSEAVKRHKAEFPELWKPLNWDEVHELQQEGVGIGLHGHSHRPILEIREEEFAEEISRAVAIFTKELGRAPKAYAVPYGSARKFTDRRLNCLKKKGFEILFSTLNGRTRLPCSGQPVSRLVVHCQDDLFTLRAKLYGAWDWIGFLRRSEHKIWELLKSS
jgi:peptidoglycan/xylan/chitin deacetylase (PgdA/CDA1 family)